MEAAILMDGTAIALYPAFSDFVYDVDGFLNEFKYQTDTKYRFYPAIYFKKQHRKIEKIEGYYKVTDYLNYIQNELTDDEQIKNLMLEPSKFNFSLFLATSNDILNIKIVDFGSPYNFFYKHKKYTFSVENTSDNKGIINYRVDLFDGLIKTGEGIYIPEGTPVIIEESNLIGTHTGHFFTKNFSDILSNIPLGEESKFKRIITLICFRINEITIEILPKILSDSITDSAAVSIYNGTNPNAYNELSDLGKLVYNIKKSWGKYFNLGFDTLFSSPPNLLEYKAYNKALINFYFKCYQIQDIIGTYPENIRLQYLLEVLPSSALSAIPFEHIVVALKNLINNRTLNESDQRFAVRLIIAILPQNADEFLDFLLEKQNGLHTNFEKLYDLLDDARLERLTVVNWFVNEQTNKMYFAKAVYELWKVSKYDLKYVPPGVNPTTPPSLFVGVNPNNFFNLDHSKLNLKNKLEIKKSGLTYEQEISTSFEQDKIKIELFDINSSIVDSGTGGVSIEADAPKVTFSQSFHFYNPVSIIGFQPSLELAIPLKSTIPAFLFHYIDEFDKIADFDAGISLVIDLTIDLLILYFSGGTSLLNDLKYLRYTTEIGKGMTGPITAINSVEVWRGISAADQVFTMTAGSLAHINNYLITTTNDPAQREILLNAQVGFMCLLAGGALKSVYSSSRASYHAKRVLDLIDALPPGAVIGLTTEHIQLLQHITGQTLVNATLFGNRLSNINVGVGVVNNFATKYINLFDDAKRLLFWKQFGNLSDETLALLNGGENGQYMINWLNLVEKNIIENKDIFFFTKQNRVDRIIQFYDEVAVRPVLEAFSIEKRAMFLDEFATISSDNFAKFVDDPQLINYWMRFEVRAEFKLFTKSNQISFLEQYGTCSLEVLNKFKANPELFKHWDECHEDYLLFRNEIQFLEELHHFKVSDLNSYDHLAFFKNRPKSGLIKFHSTGGHTENISLTGSSGSIIMSNGIEILDPNFVHSINTSTTSQRMIDYLNNTGSLLYSKTSIANGHFEHKNILFKVNPQPTTLNPQWYQQWVLNGELYEFKNLHTQYNSSWTEEKIIHDMAYASKNKVLKPYLVSMSNPKIEPRMHGLTQTWIETTYESYLLDGSPVMIKHVNYHRYNLQSPFYNHYSYFELK